MKKLILMVCCMALIAMLPACTILEKIGISSNAHDLAVEKVSDYAEEAINRKIDQSEKLSDETKTKLKAEVAKLKEEILARIAKIKAKADGGDISALDSESEKSTINP